MKPMDRPKVLTSEEVAEILARAEKATPGPLYAHGNYLSTRNNITRDVQHIDEIGRKGSGPYQAIPFDCSEDAQFYAAARIDVPELCQSHEALRAEVARLRGPLFGSAGRLRGILEFAEKECGHSPVDAKPGELMLMDGYLSMRSELAKCNNLREHHLADLEEREPIRLAVLAEIAQLRGVCAEAYQLAGAVGAPVPALDNLSDAMQGEQLRHETFLPVLDTDCRVIAGKDAEIARLKLELKHEWEMYVSRADATTEIWRDLHVALGDPRPEKVDVDGSIKRVAEAQRKLGDARKALENCDHPDSCGSERDSCARCGEELDAHPNEVESEGYVCGEFVTRPCDCPIRFAAAALADTEPKEPI